MDVLGLRSSKLGVVSNRGTLIVQHFFVLWLSQRPWIHLGLHPYLVRGLGDVQLSLHFGTRAINGILPLTLHEVVGLAVASEAGAVWLLGDLLHDVRRVLAHGNEG